MATASERLALRTVLVSMPFQDARRPSIQLGLLKALGSAAGFPVVTLHANLDFAAVVGPELYAALCDDQRGRLLGDWLFSPAAFGSAAPDHRAQLLADFAADLNYLALPDLSHLAAIRDEVVPAYLDGLVDGDLWPHVQVVGFTSTFQQNAASFALAVRLKQRFPHLVTLFGGANFDDEMGLEWTRAVGCIDIAVTGEGDLAFPAVLEALATGRDPTGIPGVAVRRRTGPLGVVSVEHSPPAAGVISMDSLPFPDYGEYFARRRRLFPRDADVGVVVPFESGRGCWWGAKHHCTFCGLNGTSMAWRAKSAHRVVEELTEQAGRHQVSSFAAVDNIMEPRYLTELLPALADSAAGFELFYEVKANLSREQLQALARAGVRYLQPGIESLSSAVLRLMDKGVRSSQNVNLLRWAQHYGIEAAWNLLWGFPGETAEDYLAQAAVVPHLMHLRPPDSVGRVWLERFSPMFTDSGRFPLRFRRPEASYRYVYPADVDLDKAAYFFEYAFVEALPDAAYEPLRTAVARWSEAWATANPPRLSYRLVPGGMEIEDTRRPGAERTIGLSAELTAIYSAISERPISVPALRRVLGLTQPPDWLERLLSTWSVDGLLFRDEDRVVALALPESPTS